MQKCAINSTFCRIPVSLVDMDDKFFSFRRTLDEKLPESIKKVGILKPPRVQVFHNKYRIVSGFRRMAALVELKIEHVEAFCYDSTVASELLFPIAIFDNMSERPFNPLEVSEIIFKYQNQFRYSTDDVVKRVLPTLGYGQNPRVLSLMEPLRNLEHEWQNLVLLEKLSLETASIFARKDKQDRDAYFSLIHKLALGKNRQREFWHLLRDIAGNTNRKIAVILNEKPIKNLVGNNRLTSSQKADKIKAQLWQQRYPVYSKVKQKFDKILSDSRLPAGVNIEAPLYFEGDVYTISLSFRSESEFGERVEFLRNLQKIGTVKKLVDVTNTEIWS
ncbi:ParB/RepB/Spo0J family partition protein [candidate division KSB1 bacterium]|nr:ParB/RepB/Spo0J family partition protein [candidate division KSB1 bacterium]